MTTHSNTTPAQQPSTKRPANAELYQHIPTAKIIELFNRGLSHRKIGKVVGMGPCSVGTRLRREGKVRRRPGLVGKELEEARLDAAWEARHGLADRVVCRLCGKFMASINANGEHSHLRTHHMTADEYASKYPGARFTSFAIAARQGVRQGRAGNVQKLMERFAAQYLTAKELIECRADPAWEERRRFDFVACRKCGLKSKTHLYLHVHRHGYSRIKEYRAEYPKAPRVSFASRRDFLSDYTKRMYAAKKAHLAELERIAAMRPADWFDKPIEWRIIGDWLLSRDDPTTNAALFSWLDDSKILECPYAEAWADVTNKAKCSEDKMRNCSEFIRKIRGWVKKPGRIRKVAAA